YDESFFSLNIFNLEDLESTFDKIEKKTFKEIWNYSGTIYIYKDSVISLNPSPNGKYVKF
ncbi:MAG: hypothetical protein PSN34_12805, partial [Urechidicola sp.]|nr:hypothetical protein [Urechidicola sp.]